MAVPADEDAADDQRAEQEEQPRHALLALELAAIRHEIPRIDTHVAVDRMANVVDGAPQIAAGDVGLNDDPALRVLSEDLIGPGAGRDPRHGAQRNLRAVRRGDE